MALLPPPVLDEKPQAHVTKLGRWWYEIDVTAGMVGVTWYRWGRRRAEAKARKELARWEKRWNPPSWQVLP